MVKLLEQIDAGKLVSAPASRAMLETLKRQQYNDGIGRKAGKLVVANKTGSLDHLRSDVGIVYTPAGPVAMAITVEDIPEVDYGPDNPGLLLLADLAQMLWEGLGAAAKP
jgi:beta-lactamase class A